VQISLRKCAVYFDNVPLGTLPKRILTLNDNSKEKTSTESIVDLDMTENDCNRLQ